MMQRLPNLIYEIDFASTDKIDAAL
jgi:hypothetical protein